MTRSSMTAFSVMACACLIPVLESAGSAQARQADGPPNCAYSHTVGKTKVTAAIQDHDGRSDPAHGHLYLTMRPEAAAFDELKFMGRGDFALEFVAKDVDLSALSEGPDGVPDFYRVNFDIPRPRYTSSKFGTLGAGWFSENVESIDIHFELDGQQVAFGVAEFGPDDTTKSLVLMDPGDGSPRTEILDWINDADDLRTLSLHFELTLQRYKVSSYGGIETDRKLLGRETKSARLDYGFKPVYAPGMDPFGTIASLEVVRRKGGCQAF